MANELPYMPMWWADYMQDTKLLSAEEHGFYLLLIGEYWLNQGPILYDEDKLCRLLRTNKRTFKRVLKNLISIYFEFKNGFIHHSRIDEELEKARTLKAARVNAGKKGAKKKQAKLVAKLKQPEPEPETTIDISNVGSFNSVGENTKSAPKKKKREATKFKKPTVDEIATYCQERSNGIDAEYFYNYYEAKGWKIGTAAMKSWKACIVTWEKRNGKNNNGKNQQTSGRRKSAVEEVHEATSEWLKRELGESN